MTPPRLPPAKYTLTTKEGGQRLFVYFVEEVKKSWPAPQVYLYSLIVPSQASAIFIRKLPASKFVGLTFKQQRCSVNIKQR